MPSVGLVSLTLLPSSTSILDDGISTYRTGDVLEGLLANVIELDRDLAENLIVGGRRDADAARFGDPLKSGRDVDAIAENVIALDQDVAEVDPDPEQHPAINEHPFVPLVHHRLHGHRAFDRIDHRGKLKEHTVPCGLDDATAVFCHESIGVTVRCSRKMRAVPTSSSPISRE